MVRSLLDVSESIVRLAPGAPPTDCVRVDVLSHFATLRSLLWVPAETPAQVRVLLDRWMEAEQLLTDEQRGERARSSTVTARPSSSISYERLDQLLGSLKSPMRSLATTKVIFLRSSTAFAPKSCQR